ncbi:MAG: hypothetical protein ACOYMG_10300 [Candidatus Methylumidiphilus sp.]
MHPHRQKDKVAVNPAFGLSGWLGPVGGFVGENPPYPATRIGYVTAVAGNQVDMQMKDSLTGGSAFVDADVIAIRLKFGTQGGFGGIG